MRIHAVLDPAPDLQHWKKTNYSYGTDTIKAEKKNRKNNYDAFTPVVRPFKIHQLCDMKQESS